MENKYWFVSYSVQDKTSTRMQGRIIFCKHPLLYLAKFSNALAIFWQEMDKEVVDTLDVEFEEIT